MTEDSTGRSFRVPRQFGHLPGYAAAGIARRPWRRPAQAAGRSHGWCSECVEENPADAWDLAAAPYILREPEWMIWRRLRHMAARHRWMRGRVAAKDAVRLLLMDRYSLATSLETIGILSDERGKPRVVCAALPETGAGVFVSISHCGNSSVALAIERSEFCRGVGIDVASRTDDHGGLAEGGFASSETALLRDCPAPERADWLLHLWCAKEAVGKALGVGLMGDPLNYIVRRIDRARRTVDVEVNVKPEHAALPDGSAHMTAHVGCDRGMAFAVARLEGR